MGEQLWGHISECQCYYIMYIYCTLFGAHEHMSSQLLQEIVIRLNRLLTRKQGM